MDAAGNTWAIVLAGGEGSRLRSLTTTASGIAIPKQFCSLRGGDSLLHDALRRAVQELSSHDDQVVLMGMLPDEADPDLGYIVPGSRDGAVSTVDRFVEKSDASLARSLVDTGALWNAFIVAANGPALLQMFIRRVPQVVNRMRQVVTRNEFTPGLSAAALDLYRNLPDIDFSRQILQGAEPALRVMQPASIRPSSRI